MTVRIVVGLVAAYAVFLILSPLLVAIMFSLGARPDNREQARRNGDALLRDAKMVVAVGAHPDDIEWYAGGTLARLSGSGARIVVVMVTDGGRLSRERRREQLEAADIVGYERVIFLDYPDGSLAKQSRREVIDKIRSVYRDYRPDTLITFDADNQGPVYHHPDHIAAGKTAVKAAALEAIPHIYLFHSGGPDTWVDISESLSTKIRGRAAHRTQTKWLLTPFGMGYIVKEAAFLDGRKAGLTYAEPFRKQSSSDSRNGAR